MRKQMPILDAPLNADERALYNVAIRLDRIIELLEIVIQEKPEVKNDVVIESKEIVEEKPKKRTSKKK